MAVISSSAAAHLSQETLNAMLRYEPETGKLFWKVRPLSMFPDERSGRVWNAKHAGREALANPIGSGYRGGNMLGGRVYSHRAVWLMTYGEIDGEIDHVNGDKTDNRLSNLRLVPHRDNMKNQPSRSDNTSGCSGVVWDGSRSKWIAKIGGKFLGRFDNINDAIAARKAAEAKHDYHPNHGRKPKP